MKNNSLRFEPDTWVKFIFKGKVCIGRTFTDHNMIMVSYTDENAHQSQVPACLLTNVVRLSFVKNLAERPIIMQDNQPGFETSVVKSDRFGSFSVKLGKN